eukprot:TRINITY_DN2488_c0_g2_i5.p1 TRINITY_DN2488_c0_g2~~TRINITY_DN2488_c0_g2_i5.p1  ORF type:complete len:356 (+),score=23.84 TRINITY_DN2488_c0_g2_i5:81-1070(+)
MSNLLFIIYFLYLVKQYTSKPSYCAKKYEAAPIQYNAIQLLSSEKPFTQTVNHQKYKKKIQKGTKVILYINGTKKGQEFFTCTSLKAGSTRMRLLLYKILNQQFDGNFQVNVYFEDEWVSAHDLGSQKLQELLIERNIPRYLFVRNPYIRAISMYNDKILRQTRKQKLFLQNIGLTKMDTNISFAQFVENLYLRPTQKLNKFNQKTPIDLHFASQSELCGLTLGMKYNYIFKQENINLWYDCFVQLIDFSDEVMHGWPGEDQCYFSSPKNPCNGPHLENDSISTGTKFFRKHDTGSEKMTSYFYDNQTIIDMVTELYLQDFVNFNYIIW